MKNLILKSVLLIAVISLNIGGFAQSDGTVQVNAYSLDDKEENVQISIKTTESFIVAANRYVLHIGGKHFLKNHHPNGNLDEIVFIIPMDEYEHIEAQSNMVLVYGLYHENTLQDQEGNQVNGFTGLHWNLGKFTPQQFTKD